MKIVGIIPARGGSKGVPRKNIRTFSGKPLIARTIESALKVRQIGRLICSTDDARIAEIARSYGCDVPFIRPKKLSGDRTPGIDVLLHALEFFKRNGEAFDTAVYLQCTSPLRRSSDISDAIKMYANNRAKSLVSVCEAEHPPYWMYTISRMGKLKKLINGNFASVRRQDLPRSYRSNGAIYINDVETIMRTKDFYKPDPVAFIMSRIHSIDIDDEIDLKLAELLIKEGLPIND